MSGLTDDRAGFLVIVLIGLKLREDIDEFANATARQRFADVQQRFVVDDPGLSLGQFVYRRAGSNDFGDGHIVGAADRFDNVLTSNPCHLFIPQAAVAHPPAVAASGDATPQRLVVSRGGIWDIIQSSIAAMMATAAPMTTCTVIAVVPWKPNTQGETSVHNPTMRFSHSSQMANAVSAAIAIATMAIPAILAFPEALPASNPNIQGETNKIAPRIRFATSHNFAFVQFSMTPSIERFPPLVNQRRGAGVPQRRDESLMKPAAGGGQTTRHKGPVPGRRSRTRVQGT